MKIEYDISLKSFHPRNELPKFIPYTCFVDWAKVLDLFALIFIASLASITSIVILASFLTSTLLYLALTCVYFAWRFRASAPWRTLAHQPLHFLSHQKLLGTFWLSHYLFHKAFHADFIL